MIFQDTRNEGNTSLTTDHLSNATIVSNIPNGVGSFLSTDIYPGHKEVLGLTVTGSGSIGSKSYFQFKYNVLENGLGNNVKISLYRNYKPIEITENYFNCIKKNEKIEGSNDTKYYETCEEKDLGLLIEETTLTEVSEEVVIGRDSLTILKENVDITKYYYVVVEFLNLEKEQNELMNRKLNGKVSVELIPSFESSFTNQIETVVSSKNTSWDKEETFSIHVTSDKYDLVSMSEDLKSWEELEEKGKEITLEKTVTENGNYTYYFQDEAENVKEVIVNATKVDNKSPVANISISSTNNIITIDASKSEDKESGIKKYYYSLDGVNFEESKENTYSMEDTGITYGVATEAIKSIPTIEVFVKVEDEAGNRSDIKKATLTRSEEFVSSIAYDKTVDNNLRYIGANPNNYVKFNNELWRIIGVMNNVDDGTGKKDTVLKLIRNESIGTIAWSDKDSSNWITSSLQVYLNTTYYASLNKESKNMLKTTLWNLGGSSIVNPLQFYVAERGSNVISGYPTTWTGKIALIYPSDYGYAVGKSKREKCLEATNCGDECYKDIWLYKGYGYDTLTPLLGVGNGIIVVTVSGAGCVNYTQAWRGNPVFPSLYLKSNVKITGGLGTSNTPFTLSLE